MSGIAVIGASETGIWTRWLFHNLERYGYRDAIWSINPGREMVFGRRCMPSLTDIDSQPQLGIVITSPDRAVKACAELLDKGTREILVISNGFRETATPEGIACEENLVRLCARASTRLIGPNCVGFARFHEGLCAIAEPIPPSIRAGTVSLISNSGAVLSGLLQSLTLDGLGIDACYSIGNGAAFDLVDAVQAVVRRNTTKLVCALVEGIPSKARLAQAISEGRQRGCDFVFLLLGQSEGSKAIAASHTGAVLGEGRLARAWLASLGVAVVDSVPEMGHTAALLSRAGRLGSERGVMIVAGSGGACGLAADALARRKVPLARLSEQTIQRLRQQLPEGSQPANPLDIVSGTSQERGEICRTLCADPAVGILLEPIAVVWADDSKERQRHRETISSISAAAIAENKPYVLSSVYHGPLTGFIERMHSEGKLVGQAGLEITASALEHVYAHAAWPVASRGSERPDAVSSTTRGEAQGRRLLEQQGIAVTPGELVGTIDEAVAASRRIPGPWVVKIGNEGIGHKGRIGGVRVGLCNAEEISGACRSIAESAVRRGVAKRPIDVKYLVQQMVIGPELLVTGVRDKIVGPSITVGVGGWAAEAGHIFLTVPLPDASNRSFADHIEASQLGRLLDAQQKQALAEMLLKLSRAFLADSFSSFDVVECNPVILAATGAVAADVLILGAAA